MANSEVDDQKLTGQQQRVLKLLFKFRFISAGLLADIMDIRRVSVYQVLEDLVKKGMVVKVYSNEFRIDRKPAYYYLTKPGVTIVRKLLNVKESVVHTLYKNADATTDFIEHSLKTAFIYTVLMRTLPKGTDIFTKAEINRFKQFPKNRPDLYVRTPDGKEAIMILVDDKAPNIIRKRLDEVITHSEDEGWEGDYPHICFILKDGHAKNSFLYGTRKKLENMGMDEGEIHVLATSLKDFTTDSVHIWSSVLAPQKGQTIFGLAI